jgi:hypothetical protein
MRRTWLGLAAAVAVLATSIGIVIAHSGPRPTAGMMTGHDRNGAGIMGGTGMMGAPGMTGTVWSAGDGRRVAFIADARQRAATAGARLGLHPGEVIWFDNGFYVELKDAAGDSATEVIVDPADGTVRTEPGPAMMWNTRYGMHAAGAAPTTVSAGQAQRLATAWLGRNLPGRLAQPPDAYPGYYTLETTASDGTVNGMLSVNATSGQVWYHTWHGRFIARQDA